MSALITRPRAITAIKQTADPRMERANTIMIDGEKNPASGTERQAEMSVDRAEKILDGASDLTNEVMFPHSGDSCISSCRHKTAILVIIC